MDRWFDGWIRGLTETDRYIYRGMRKYPSQDIEDGKPVVPYI